MRRRRRPTLHHAVKDKRVTVLGPVKQPEMDFMSHRGGMKRQQLVCVYSYCCKGERGVMKCRQLVSEVMSYH